MGTSAGALSGSLYSAGYSPKQVEALPCAARLPENDFPAD